MVYFWIVVFEFIVCSIGFKVIVKFFKLQLMKYISIYWLFKCLIPYSQYNIKSKVNIDVSIDSSVGFIC